jgi:uncharacterized membrane protein YhaH (DUF805 family)
MHAYRVRYCAAGRLLWLALAALLIRPLGVAGATEETFAVLQVGTQTYKNVTVTTKAKNYVFIVHAAGMTSIKLSQLPSDLQEKLGYAVAKARIPATNTSAAWVKREISNLSGSQVRGLTKQMEQKCREQFAARLTAMGFGGPTFMLVALGVTLLLYLFHCYCCALICWKTGKPPGILIWLPVLQLYPLLRAAGMSGWWLLACFVPVVNLVPLVLWPLKIAKARGKSVWVGVLLLLPVASLFAFLYLAFSDGVSDEDDEGPEAKIMTLETA